MLDVHTLGVMPNSIGEVRLSFVFVPRLKDLPRSEPVVTDELKRITECERTRALLDELELHLRSVQQKTLAIAKPSFRSSLFCLLSHALQNPVLLFQNKASDERLGQRHRCAHNGAASFNVHRKCLAAASNDGDAFEVHSTSIPHGA